MAKFLVKVIGPSEYTKTYEVAASERGFTCPDLTPYQTYTVAVSIVNSNGVEGVPAHKQATTKATGKLCTIMEGIRHLRIVTPMEN